MTQQTPSSEPSDRPAKPVPTPDEESQPFFDAAQRGVLMVRRCSSCGAFQAPVVESCPECLRDDLAWVEVSGRGTLFTFGVMHQNYHPGFTAELPYNVAVVELEEGPRLNTNVVGAPNEQLEVGMALEVTFEDAGEGVRLPKFRPAG